MAEPTLAEIIRSALDARLLDLHVALPCRVESYDATAQTVEVMPLVRRAIEDDIGETQHEDLPKLPNVPVLFPRSAAFSATWPLAPGDTVLVVFCSSAIGNWRESGDLADPGDLRRHDLSHAIAIPGIAPDGDTIPTSSTAAVLEVNPPATHVEVGSTSATFVALAALVESLVDDLADAILNAAVTPNDGGAGLQTAAKATLTGLGWTGTTPPTDTTAATKLKSE